MRQILDFWANNATSFCTLNSKWTSVSFQLWTNRWTKLLDEVVLSLCIWFYDTVFFAADAPLSELKFALAIALLVLYKALGSKFKVTSSHNMHATRVVPDPNKYPKCHKGLDPTSRKIYRNNTAVICETMRHALVSYSNYFFWDAWYSNIGDNRWAFDAFHRF